MVLATTLGPTLLAKRPEVVFAADPSLLIHGACRWGSCSVMLYGRKLVVARRSQQDPIRLFNLVADRFVELKRPVPNK
jgi:hypothetical protein